MNKKLRNIKEQTKEQAREYADVRVKGMSRASQRPQNKNWSK